MDDNPNKAAPRRAARWLVLAGLGLSLACARQAPLASAARPLTATPAPAPAPAPAPSAPPASAQAPAPEGGPAAPAAPAPAPTPDPERQQLWVGSSTVGFDIPVAEHVDVEAWRNRLSRGGRRVFSTWLQRAGTYVPMMERVLTGYGLPRDLVFLSMIESGFQPEAASWAGAAGLWQFIPSTARRYGLKVGFWVDERRDPLKSTHAAAQYLAHLHDLYGGDWLLAFAAYNAGPGSLNRALDRERGEEFWDLSRSRYLRRETKQYVPKLIAAAQVSKTPEVYGLTPITYNAPLRWETLQVDRATSMAQLAQACLRAEADPGFGTAGRPAPVVAQAANPAGSNAPAAFAAQAAHAAGTLLPATTHQTLPAMALQRQAPKLMAVVPPLAPTEPPAAPLPTERPPLDAEALSALNPELRTGVTPPGQPYRVHVPLGWSQTCARGLVGLPLAERQDFRYVALKGGERLASIAKRYHTTPAAILRFNRLKRASQLRGLDELVVPIPAAVADRVPIDAPAQRRRLSIYDPSREQLVIYRVRSGDSLWRIARRYRSSIRKLRRMNGLRSNRLRLGQRLRIPLGRK